MNNQPWDKAKLEEWKKFWDSEMGQEAINKMKTLKDTCLRFALEVAEPEKVTFYVGRAAGIDLVIADIEAGFRALDETKEKEAKQKAKK
jgi:hypothetical protein